MAETQHRPVTAIRVVVNFALSQKPPFRDEFEPSATILQVRTAAMAYFEVHEDPTSVFYLTHNRRRLDDSAVLADVVGHAHAAEFRLNKELVQG